MQGGGKQPRSVGHRVVVSATEFLASHRSPRPPSLFLALPRSSSLFLALPPPHLTLLDPTSPPPPLPASPPTSRVATHLSVLVIMYLVMIASSFARQVIYEGSTNKEEEAARDGKAGYAGVLPVMGSRKMER